jgi:hypothetical protein
VKFIGAMLSGLAVMGAAVYFVARSKDQRSSDAAAAKSLASQIFTSMKNYMSKLVSPAPSTPEAV